ncbi:ABC transporter ATP-binding protein [Sulfitobacter pseudonitzschiae]|jgi:branched-chain amino acid transport system ATP-binding protein|uniref:ABC transporter ATP-binding protein n=2 Tax=Roseobacteraceae TaxID=2854170 RepID=A0A073IW07_9RHOB|nr:MULTISPECIES: ABC transporter ATP-binding protein [Roseobacteraceae]MAB17349.1 ABC transporter ATP-binding protein [Roseobacter sp.]AXI52441.1 ABC transporter ATP-binding protein [Sulfitobacter sp. SK025]KEJ93646.1 branched-chain amino acid ABC transporter ATP-binding protein [Pseudosulfitobacter pseudonitzschiae]MBM1818180.1 ABC transporter ATP-binding protein [Pseudosulfitobacter pseudonitzschiae]MBM1835234.1 ABC transporter ATP-binding protein [Pseudosulfitobacter pseudonitzschiae]|tara:strand:+ start:73 stop:864 length:792 start_codon:yes stop_codon:yes gene_type:complete
MLNVNNVQIVYDNVIEAVRDASLSVDEGQIVTLLGSNGAGKSTILKGISGVLYPEDGDIIGGTITLNGESLIGRKPDEIVRSGVVMVPEGRQLFEPLTVEENLMMGGITRSRSGATEALENVFDIFPRVKEKRSTIAGYLSGGEQQMVAIGRALMSSPRLLMLDEPSLGLAPQIIAEIFAAVSDLSKQNNVSVLLVEQNAELALSIASYAYIIENGRVVMDGPPDKLMDNEDVKEFYLGFSESGHRRNMRDVKHYKRRKRWLS